MEKILDGKKVAEHINEDTKNKVNELKNKGITPTLALFRVGNNPSDVAYEKSSINYANKLGIEIKQYTFDSEEKEENIINEIKNAGENDDIHGIMLFRPLPKNLDEEKIRNIVNPSKDVDGITDKSLVDVFISKNELFHPCTAQACMEIMKFYDIDLKGKNISIIGRSLVIGKPVAMMVLEKNGTPTICHSKTKDIETITRNSDIVIVAIGKAKAINENYFSENQVIIDVGINVDEKGKLCGDVDFENVKNVCNAITPVPGGVGSVTTSILMNNVVKSAEKSSN